MISGPSLACQRLPAWRVAINCPYSAGALPSAQGILRFVWAYQLFHLVPWQRCHYAKNHKLTNVHLQE